MNIVKFLQNKPSSSSKELSSYRLYRGRVLGYIALSEEWLVYYGNKYKFYERGILY